MMTLFIGGPHDGKWLNVKKAQQIIEMASTDRPSDVSTFSYGSPLPSVSVAMTSYRLHQLVAERRRFVIYAVASMPLSDVFEMLLRGYYPSKLRR